MNNRFFIKTFGCKTNQIESEYIKKLLQDNNYIETSFVSDANVCIVNSCTVTQTADKKVLGFIKNVKKKNKNIKVIAIGCYCQTHTNQAIENPNIDIVLGNNEKFKILEYLNKIKYYEVSNILDQNEFEEFTVNNVSKTRATIKIEDGCNNRCSYCIIPFARGKVRSNKLENIINQINILENNGYNEVVLTGIHIGQWGVDFGLTFNHLLKNIEKTNIKQYRLGSLTPNELDDDFFEIVSNSQKFCPHFHLSIQSLCDKTLKSMNRHYTADEYKALCDKLRSSFENASLTTDIMVGFNDETELDFNESLDFVKSIAFEKVHVFPYSERVGTAASKRGDNVPKQEKERRAAVMIEETEKIRHDYLKKLVGTNEKVLFENEIEPNLFQGYTKSYLPVRMKYNRNIVGEELEVKIIDYTDEFCIAE